MIRIYCLILVGLLALLLAVWPRSQNATLLRGSLRFGVLFCLGGSFVLFGFHRAGRVEHLAVFSNRVLVHERFEGQWLGEIKTTALELETGSIVSFRLPRPTSKEADHALTLGFGQGGRLVVPQALEARLRRGDGISVGPLLQQPVLAFANERFAVVSARKRVSKSDTVYLARIDEDGEQKWRMTTSELGLGSGDLEGGVPISASSGVFIYRGLRADRTLWDKISQATHLVVLRVDLLSGDVLWRTAL